MRSLSDGIDPETSTGRLMLNMLATLAEYERELIPLRCPCALKSLARLTFALSEVTSRLPAFRPCSAAAAIPALVRLASCSRSTWAARYPSTNGSSNFFDKS